MADNTCEFELDGLKCPCTEVVGIARCRGLCKVHFDTVCKDNIRRFNKGQDIPTELVFTKHLTFSETWSFIQKLPEYKEFLIKYPEYRNIYKP